MLANFSRTGRKFTGLVARWSLLFQEVSVTFPVGRMEDTDNANAHHIYQCLLGCLAVCRIPPPPVEVSPPFDAFFFFSLAQLLCSPACHLPRHLWVGAELRRLWDER